MWKTVYGVCVCERVFLCVCLLYASVCVWVNVNTTKIAENKAAKINERRRRQRRRQYKWVAIAVVVVAETRRNEIMEIYVGQAESALWSATWVGNGWECVGEGNELHTLTYTNVKCTHAHTCETVVNVWLAFLTALSILRCPGKACCAAFPSPPSFSQSPCSVLAVSQMSLI